MLVRQCWQTVARDQEEDNLVAPEPEPIPVATNTAVPEHNHVGESQNNGAVKRAMQMGGSAEDVAGRFE